MLDPDFFDCDAALLAKNLLGKVLRVYHKGFWLSVQVVETEAYYLEEKASHSSLGYNEKRKALFMQAGTIYMYYARGADSLNISARGKGNAVLIKSGIPYISEDTPNEMLTQMQTLNPPQNQTGVRTLSKLCAGQTLLCRALGLKVGDWDQQQFTKEGFYISDMDYQPKKIIQTTRLGISQGRDEDLPYRFIDYDYADSATENPLRKRKWVSGEQYLVHEL